MTQHDYNRTDDPLMRGWTRKQPRRTGVPFSIIVGILLVGAVLASLVACNARPASGAAIEVNPVPTALFGPVPQPVAHYVHMPIAAK